MLPVQDDLEVALHTPARSGKLPMHAEARMHADAMPSHREGQHEKGGIRHARSNVVGLADPAALSALRSRLDHMLHGVCITSHILVLLLEHLQAHCPAPAVLQIALQQAAPQPQPPNPWPTSSISRVQG